MLAFGYITKAGPRRVSKPTRRNFWDKEVGQIVTKYINMRVG